MFVAFVAIAAGLFLLAGPLLTKYRFTRSLEYTVNIGCVLMAFGCAFATADEMVHGQLSAFSTVMLVLATVWCIILTIASYATNRIVTAAGWLTESVGLIAAVIVALNEPQWLLVLAISLFCGCLLFYGGMALINKLRLARTNN